MNARKILLAVIISIVTVLTFLGLLSPTTPGSDTGIEQTGSLLHFAHWNDDDQRAEVRDFREAVTIATPAVVHVQTHIIKQKPGAGDDGYDDPGITREMHGSGSGVILSSDGYIVTNNHVIDGADEIKVTLPDRRTYKATVTGTDPKTDLAVLRIHAADLPFLVYGNSDTTRVGQWVLAIGYPFDLDETVTAGIISVKAVPVANDKTGYPLRFFIQTDAAINLGNSGGALIDTNGELIGVTTAISSPTGIYTGYGYAIPVNAIRKIVNDIIKFGSVQKPTAENRPKEKVVNDADEVCLHWLFLNEEKNDEL